MTLSNEKDAAKEEHGEGECRMGQYDRLTPEEQARITEIQDVLIERYVEQKRQSRAVVTLVLKTLSWRSKSFDAKKMRSWSGRLHHHRPRSDGARLLKRRFGSEQPPRLR